MPDCCISVNNTSIVMGHTRRNVLLTSSCQDLYLFTSIDLLEVRFQLKFSHITGKAKFNFLGKLVPCWLIFEKIKLYDFVDLSNEQFVVQPPNNQYHKT